MAAYPFVRLEEEKRRLLAAGVDVIDFGKGDPNEPTDPMIRQALVDALPERAPYPLAQGLPELRDAAAGWIERRFGVAVDPDTEIVPTYGSKEAIFSLAQVLDVGGQVVAFGEPAYPVYKRGALFAGASVRTLPLRRGAAGDRLSAEVVPPDGRDCAAGVRPARVRRRVERRAARRGDARTLPREARDPDPGARSAGLGDRRERGDDVPLDRRARRG